MNGADSGGRAVCHEPAVACLLELRVRIPSAACDVCCVVLLGTGLWGGPIARPEESYRVWCV